MWISMMEQSFLNLVNNFFEFNSAEIVSSSKYIKFWLKKGDFKCLRYCSISRGNVKIQSIKEVTVETWGHAIKCGLPLVALWIRLP